MTRENREQVADDSEQGAPSDKASAHRQQSGPRSLTLPWMRRKPRAGGLKKRKLPDRMVMSPAVYEMLTEAAMRPRRSSIGSSETSETLSTAVQWSNRPTWTAQNRGSDVVLDARPMRIMPLFPSAMLQSAFRPMSLGGPRPVSLLEDGLLPSAPRTEETSGLGWPGKTTAVQSASLAAGMAVSSNRGSMWHGSMTEIDDFGMDTIDQNPGKNGLNDSIRTVPPASQESTSPTESHETVRQCSRSLSTGNLDEEVDVSTWDAAANISFSSKPQSSSRASVGTNAPQSRGGDPLDEDVLEAVVRSYEKSMCNYLKHQLSPEEILNVLTVL